MADHVVLKISFEDQMRRTQLVQPLTIAQVREQISRLFPNVKHFTLSYLDEEGDKITVSSDIELQEAHRVCHPNIRLTLEKLDQPTSSSFTALPGGSLLDHVSPSLQASPPPADAHPPSIISNPVGSLLNFLSPSASEEDEELQKQLEEIYLQEKEEKEAKEKAEREEHERQERERVAKEKAEIEERERLERERIEREERERQELERKEREARELLEKLEQEKLREEQLRLEKEKKILEQQQNSKEQERERILQSNEKCGEILERLLSEGVELELAWQALEFSSYSNEKRARDLLKMNELGLDFRKASDALTRFNGNFESAVDSLME